MPEIKNTFTQGKMNKDLDERIVPNGQYRDAMNVEVATSDGSEIGTVQNILGNSSVEDIVGPGSKCVGSIADEKNNKLYWFVKGDFSASQGDYAIDAIYEYSIDSGAVPVVIDYYAGTNDAVLKFPDKIITGINIVDNLLLWTDGINEPRKINIDWCKQHTAIDGSNHTSLTYKQGSFDGITVDVVSDWDPDLAPGQAMLLSTDPNYHMGDEGQYVFFHRDQFEKLFEQSIGGSAINGVTVRQFRDGKLIWEGEIRIWNEEYTNSDGTIGVLGNGFHFRRETLGASIANNGGALSTQLNPTNTDWKIGDVIFGGFSDQLTNTDGMYKRIAKPLEEKHITVIKKAPSKTLNVKINTSIGKNKDPLFEKIFPRFSYRYQYIDNEYSPFAPFTDVVFNPEHKESYSVDNAYDIREPYNTSMANSIESIELTDFVPSDIQEDVVKIDILYKQENSNVVYSIASIKRSDSEWHLPGSGQNTDLGSTVSDNGHPAIWGGLYKGKYTVQEENIYAAVPEDQLLRPWDNVPKKALAQEITSNRLIYGNYTQGYNLEEDKLSLLSDFKQRGSIGVGNQSFNDKGLPSVKSQRNYQLGVVFGDKYGRETPVFTSKESAIKIPWESQGNLSASKSNQLISYIQSNLPNFAEYFKFFVKETSGEYYNLIMDKVHIPAGFNSFDEIRDHIWISFPSSDRNKVSIDDYLIMKKEVGTGEQQIELENKFKILDIDNEAPDAVRYEYIPLGQIANNTTTSGFGTGASSLLNESVANNGIFFQSGNRPVGGAEEIVFSKTNWFANGGFPLTDTDSPTATFPDLYFSFSKVIGAQQLDSKKYKVASVRINNNNVYFVKLSHAISAEDGAISEDPTTNTLLNDNLTVRFERRSEKNLELFSGRFFVKIVQNNISTSDNMTDAELLSNYVISAQQNSYWLADTQNNNDFDPNDGILNSTFNTTMPSGGTNTAKLLGAAGLDATNLETAWDSISNTVGGKFFIDNMYMCAGQISSSNIARGAGQTWVGPLVTYRADDMTWMGAGVTIPGGTYQYGWNITPHRNSTQWVGTAIKESQVNGLEGVVVSETKHTSSDIASGPGNGGGIRRWKTDMGYHGNPLVWTEYASSTDNTYGPEDTTGKFFMHLSFLAPGSDLVPNNISGDALFGANAIGHSLQGVWGGGILQPLMHSGYSSQTFGTGNDHSIIPMEGKFPIEPTDPGWGAPGYLPPGPGVLNTFGYDMNFQDLHENQWNPTYPSDPENKIQAFINHLEVGAKFKFTNDTSDTIYTIKNKSIKKIYNHTPWRWTPFWNDNTNAFEATDRSVESAGIAWGETLDASGSGGDAAKLSAFKQKITDFGKANNRRVCYILELDKDPASSTSYNPVDGSNIDADTFGNIEFITNNTTVLLQNTFGKPAIFETEPKETTDLDIYYEASSAIPSKINRSNREMFAPVGSKIEIVTALDALNGGITIMEQVFLKRWVNETDIELSPGLNYRDINGAEIDYSNVEIRFHRSDGSYTTGKMGVVSSEMDIGQDYKTIFEMDTNIEPGMEMGLSWNNCFSFGNGIESSRIRDDFNAMRLMNGPKASSTIEKNYQEEVRKNGLIYSGIYNSNSGVNSLNQFIVANRITKDLNPTYGSIQKLFQRRSSASYGDTLIAFCEDRVVGIVSSKDAIYNADGTPQLVSSNRVLGDANPFVGDYGISKNPESFAQESYRAYFADKQRGAVLRLSMDGITPISEAGMHDWFRDNLQDAGEILGTYDEYKQDYNLSLTKIYSEELLRNSNISEGDPLLNVFPAMPQLIQNGGVSNGTNLTLANIDDLNMGIAWRYLQSKTTITNHDLITLGSIVPFSSAVVGWNATDAVFTNNWGTFGTNVFNQHGTNLQMSDGAWQAGGDHPFLNPSNCNDQDNYVWARVIDGGLPHTAATYTGTIPFLCDSNTTSGQLGSNPTGFEPGATQFRCGKGFVGTIEDFTTVPIQSNRGIACTNQSADDYVLVPWEHESGNLLTGNVSSDVLNWVNDPENINNIDYSNANDTTMFSGEEIEVRVKVTCLVQQPNFVLKLYDGTSLIPDSAVHDPGYIDGATNVPYNETAFDFASPDNWTLGYQTSTTVAFAQHPFGNQEKTQEYKARFKFTNAGNNEGIVVNNLKVGFGCDASNIGAGNNYFIDHIKIKKGYTFTTPENVGSPSIPQQDPIPPADVPAWAEVEYELISDNNYPGWSFSGSGTWQIAANSVDSYGLPNPSSTDSATDNSGTTHTWVTGTDNGLTAYNDYSDGPQGDPNSIPAYGTIDTMYVDAKTNGPNSVYITQSLKAPEVFEVGEWYMVDVFLDGTQSDPDPPFLYIRGVMDNGIAQGLSPGDVGYPDGHFGTTGGAATDHGMKLTPTTYTNEDGWNDLPVGMWHGQASGVNNGDEVFRAIFQVTANSHVIANNTPEEFKLQFYNSIAEIKFINVIKISEVPTGGTANNWGIGPLGMSGLINAMSNPMVWHDNGKFHYDWVDTGVSVWEARIIQDFDSNPTTPWQLMPSANGYKLELLISNYVSGDIIVQCRGYYDGVTPWNGVHASGFTGDGLYTIHFNVDGTLTDMTVTDPSIPNALPITAPNGNIQEYTTLSGYNQANLTNPAHDNKFFIMPHGPSGPLNMSISGISLKDANPVITAGGTVNAWDFTGFDPTAADPPIRFDNGTIRLHNANNTHQITQVISEDLPTDASYRVRFSHNLSGNAEIRFYYFNSNGDGMVLDGTPYNPIDPPVGGSFSSDFITGLSPNQGTWLQGIMTPETPDYYDKVHKIGEITTSQVAVHGYYMGLDINDTLYNTFVIQIMDGPAFGHLDNFSVQRVYPEFEPKTVTFSEDVRGWVSFKSFIPENGLSLSKRYYTMKDGHLFEHYTNENRNQFYDENVGSITESYVVAVLNSEPSLVKIFNTLNYEGSQSRIEQSTSPLTVRPDNITGKDGWYVEYVKTDKQEGTLIEFIEKEGKWFNYIRGNVNDIKPADLSFQGLGVVSSVTTQN